MIMTGMGVNYNGLWEESQLSGDLQRIIAWNREYFDGKPVTEGNDSDSDDDILDLV